MDYLTENNVYENIRSEVEKAWQKVYAAVNFAMVETYWNIGKQIYEAQGENERAEYGKGLLKFLSEKLTEEFGKGFTVTNLKYMRQFYIAFTNRHALSDQLSWTHYRMLLKVEDEKARTFYLNECVKSNWSTRQLERQINSFYYQRLLSSQDKDSVRNEIQKLEKGIDAKDIIRDPYVLEFLGLEQTPNLYVYDFKTDNYKKLIEISSYEGYFQICGFNEDYMILRLSEDEWRTCQLYYLRFEQMILTNFFSYSIDTETDRVYAQNFNNIELIGDKVYFDDFYEDTNGELRVKLYEYTIGKQQLISLLEDAQNPMVYNREIISFRKNSEGKFKDIVSVDNNLILSNTKHLKQITANGNGFFCIENNSTNDKTKTTTFQITDMLKNKPVLSTNSSIANLDSNSRFVTWTNYYEEKPYMYDTDKEQLLLFSAIPVGVNNFFFSNELGLLMNTSTDSSKSRVFIFTPQ